MRRVPVACALALALGPARAAAAQSPPPLVFATQAEVVRVEVSVTRDGRPVGGLTTADFEIRDSGVLQRLNPVVGEAVPLDVALVLDMSQSVQGRRLEELRAAADAFLGGLRPADRAAMFAFSHQIAQLQPLTHELGAVRAALARASGSGATALRDAVFAALRLPETAGDRRAAAVVLTDGIDTASWLEKAQVIDSARRGPSVVYFVLADPHPGSGVGPDRAFLRDVSRETGGRLFEVGRRSLEASFVEVLEHIRSRYLLSYFPEPTPAAGWHRLSVKVKRPGLDVQVRPGYFRSPSPR
ncbi:MAG: VWA domain-containing protein [Vicinamibacteria bacterium]